MGSDDEQQATGSEDGREEIRALEEADEVPSDPKDWPDGKAKFLTFDNESDEPFGEGATAKLGPGSVQHHEDGSVTVDGDEVDDPSKFKGDPIPGGPTDPSSERLEGEGED